MNEINKSSLLILVIILLATGCSTKQNANQKNKTEREVTGEEKIVHDIEQLMGDMPPLSLIPFNLKSIGATFDRTLTNSLENIEAYKTNNDKVALNMGIFASDISYFAAYGHEKDCIDYLKASQEMAEFLGKSSVRNKQDLEKFRGYINDQNDEEMSKILAKLFVETSVKIERDHHLTVMGLALTGSFVEGLYHAVKTIEASPASEELEPLVELVLEEEKVLLDIIQVLEDLPFDDTIASIMTELSILDRLYKGDLKKIEDEMANNPEYVITKDVMRDITLEVKRIRASIVE